MLKIAVLISGNGSNLLSIIESIENGYLENVELKYVISDRKDAKGILKAKEKGFNTIVLDREIYGKSLSDEILNITKDKVDLIVLAGYLSILNGNLVKVFNDRIINIHPSLIPSFCGKGMYGIKVHEAAIKRGVKYSGCTVHFVNNGIDEGDVIDQQIVRIKENETAESLQKRILKEEHKLLPAVIRKISEDKTFLTNSLLT